jgi:hypothetical protein
VLLASETVSPPAGAGAVPCDRSLDRHTGDETLFDEKVPAARIR